MLIAASIVLIAFSWRKCNNAKLIPFYICISGLIYIFELVSFVILDSYRYMPGIFKDLFYDSAIGAVVSNGFIVPSACVFIAVYNLSFLWILLISAGFMGVEQLFLHLDIFEHHWWKTIYTGIGLIVLFLIGKRLWRKMNEADLPYYFRLIALYIINVSLQGSVQFFYIVLFHQVEYRPGWFEDPSRDNISFATIIVHMDSVLFAIAISLRAHWLWKAVILAGIGGGLLWLIQLDVLITSGIWPVFILFLLQIALLQLLSRLNRILTAKSGARNYGQA
ncbi:hypothetical protein ACFSL6_02295 [Paenibacillus thailandensis]|uniref:Uncharacterized protein n=1 Tax=Paenibacillus thailandensis TaxID=393250 RepID=A0ABW5QUU3_9BACL